MSSRLENHLVKVVKVTGESVLSAKCGIIKTEKAGKTRGRFAQKHDASASRELKMHRELFGDTPVHT